MKPFAHAVTLSESDAHAIAAGKLSQIILPKFETETVPLTLTYKPARYARMRRGDFMWVRERHCMFSDKSASCGGIGYGSPTRAEPPANWKGHDQNTARIIVREAAALPRFQSRLTLEVEEITEGDTWRLESDVLLKSGVFRHAGGYGDFFGTGQLFSDPRDAFRKHWESQHSIAQTFVQIKALVVRFGTHLKNIDELDLGGRDAR